MDHLITRVIVSSTLLFLASILFLITRIAEKRVYEKSRTGTFLKHLHGPVQILLTLALLYLIFTLLPLHAALNPILDNLFTITMIIGFGWLAMKCLSVFTAMLLQPYNIQAKDNYRARLVYTRVGGIKRLIGALIVAITVVCVLMTFEAIRAQGMSILASAGVMSIIVGFAAQKTIANFFAGLQIAIAQPIRIDDAVLLENEWGTIEEIRLTYVVVKLWDLRRLIVPISYFTDHVFQNWTQKTADILAQVMLYVDHAMPIQPIRDEVDRILKDNKLWDGKVKAVQIVEILEHCLQVRILASAPNSGTAFDLRCAIREHLMAFMQIHYSEFLPRVRIELKNG